MMMHHSRGYPYEVRDNVPAPNLALLYFNKKLTEEVLHIRWEGSLRCFIDHQIFTAVADSKVGVATRFDILGRIRLSFTTRS